MSEQKTLLEAALELESAVRRLDQKLDFGLGSLITRLDRMLEKCDRIIDKMTEAL